MRKIVKYRKKEDSSNFVMKFHTQKNLPIVNYNYSKVQFRLIFLGNEFHNRI